jgi:CheY-like chemotaxis protein
MNKIMNQNILLVDDRPENIIALENILENPGLNLIKANSGDEALRLLLKNDVALILLDVQMPGMDGFETATYVRGAPNTKHIPIIFVTAINKEQKHIFKGYESGAVDYMFKPIDPDILRSKVNIFLELDRQRKILELKNKELEESKANTDNILENVKDGLFLLDNELNFKPQYSLILEKIFLQKNLGNSNFISYLDKKIPDKLKLACKDYLELMFRDDIHEKTIEELNPLTEIETKFENGSKGSDILKILSFNFKRVSKNENKIGEIIATVRDITDKVNMLKKLQDSEENSKKQMELAFSILHVEPQLLSEFIRGAQSELKKIDELLNKNTNVAEYSLTLKKVYRSVHFIKGNASLLDLKFFVTQAHKLEEMIINVQRKDNIEGADFSSLVLKLSEIKSTLSEIIKLIDRIKNMQSHFRPKQRYENELFIKSLDNFVSATASDSNKKVKFLYKDFNIGMIPYRYRLLIKEILIQLIRNAIYHGIEEMNERKIQKKNIIGSIELSTFESKSNFGFKLKDDGKGLQIEKLRQMAKSSGKWNQKEIEKWNEEQVAELIFKQGISTSEEINLIAGRGVGMDSVKDRLKDIGGKIEVRFEKNKFCEFMITVPIQKKDK